MSKLPGINHQDAVRALEKAGFWALRRGRHVVMTNEERKPLVPRHNAINAITTRGIVRDAGLSIDEFRKLF